MDVVLQSCIRSHKSNPVQGNRRSNCVNGFVPVLQYRKDIYRTFTNVTMTLWDRDATTLFSFNQSITHSFIRYTQHTAVMSAIFDFSSLITVFVLSICTTTYLRELRPAIFDTSIPSMAGGDGGGRTPSAVGSFQSDDATTTNTANNNQSLSPQQRQQAHHHREGIMGFLWKLSRIGERCSPYISIACILQALNILFWK